MLTIDNLRVFNIRGGGLHPVLVELSTKDGIKGYGEAAVAYGIGANAAAGMLSDLAHKVVGQDATYPRNIWHEIYDNVFWTKGGGAIGAGRGACALARRFHQSNKPIATPDPIRKRSGLGRYCDGCPSDGRRISRPVSALRHIRAAWRRRARRWP